MNDTGGACPAPGVTAGRQRRYREMAVVTSRRRLGRPSLTSPALAFKKWGRSADLPVPAVIEPADREYRADLRATWDGMTTSSDHVGPPAQPEAAGLNLLSDKAKATVEEIKAENAALKEADQAAEAQVEAAAEEAKQLAEVTEEVLAEVKENQEGANRG